MVDDHGNGVPGAWVLMPGERATLFARWLRVLKDRMGPDWRPSCFVVDDCDAEINAIKCVLSMPASCNTTA